MNFKVGAVVALASTMLAASTTASAGEMDSGWFVGGTVGMAKRSLYNGEDVAIAGKDGAGIDELDGSAVLGLRAGKYLNDHVRVYADLTMDKGSSESHNGIDSSVDDMQLSMSADYVDTLFGMKKLKYFAGATMGVNKMEFEVNNGLVDGYDGKQSDKGLVYGGQLGVIYDFTNNLSGEVGYQYLVLNNKADFDMPGLPDELEAKSKNKQTLMMNLSYKF